MLSERRYGGSGGAGVSHDHLSLLLMSHVPHPRLTGQAGGRGLVVIVQVVHVYLHWRRSGMVGNPPTHMLQLSMSPVSVSGGMSEYGRISQLIWVRVTRIPATGGLGGLTWVPPVSDTDISALSEQWRRIILIVVTVVHSPRVGGTVGVVVTRLVVPGSTTGLLSGADGAGVAGGTVLTTVTTVHGSHPGCWRRLRSIHHIQTILRVTVIKYLQRFTHSMIKLFSLNLIQLLN